MLDPVSYIVKQPDEDIVAYLERTMASVVKNYKVSVESKQPEVLWANFGDITQVYAILKALKKRNDLREAQKP